MNFNRSEWFTRYFEFRSDHPLPLVLPSQGVKVVEGTGIHNDLEQAVYYFLQPTGLIYGSLVETPFPREDYPKSRYFDSMDRIFIVFLESLFGCLVADRQFQLADLVEDEDRFQSAVVVAMGYFLDEPDIVRAEIPTNGKGGLPLPGGRRARRAFERAIKRTITRGSTLFYRPELLSNSMLFLDLYGCLLWQRETVVDPESARDSLDRIAAIQLEWREALLRLLFSTAHSDGALIPTARRLVNHFIKSSGFDRDRRRHLQTLAETPRPLSTVELPAMPWIVRRFFLELVLMTVLVDQHVSGQEQAYLAEIVERLELWEGELVQSQSALELFLLDNEDQLHYLRTNSNVAGFSKRLQERAVVVVRKNLDRLVEEIQQTRELYSLLVKSSKEPLTAEEKHKVREQLMDILKTIPALAIFALPGGGIILPVLIKLLPFNLLPSAFED